MLRILDDDSEQWAIEVETWFVKAILGGILTFQNGFWLNLRVLNPEFGSKYIRDWSSCSRILFHDPASLNINWIGLWATMVPLVLVGLVGYRVEFFHDALRAIQKGLLSILTPKAGCLAVGLRLWQIVRAIRHRYVSEHSRHLSALVGGHIARHTCGISTK